MATKPRKVIHVNFERPVGLFPERRHDGCGVHSSCGPYAGPSTFPLTGIDSHGERRVFNAVRLERSPMGSVLGSFRIDEVIHTPRGPSTIVHGYHCSYPDFDTCLRVARNHYTDQSSIKRRSK